MDLVLASINHDSLPLAVLIIKCVHIKESKAGLCCERIKLQFLILAVAIQWHSFLQFEWNIFSIIDKCHGFFFF